MSLETYVPILMFMIVGLAFGCVLLIAGWLLSPARPDPDKLAPYECGFEAFEDARMRFDVRYYLVAILFILFDLEIAFLSRGRWRSGNRLRGLSLHDGVPRHSDRRVHLRMEKGALDWE